MAKHDGHRSGNDNRKHGHRSGSDSRKRGKPSRPGLDIIDFILTRRTAPVVGLSPTLVQRPVRGRGSSDLVDPAVTEKIEQLEAIGLELTRRGPFDLLRRLHAQTNARLARLRDDES